LPDKLHLQALLACQTVSQYILFLIQIMKVWVWLTKRLEFLN